MVIIAENINENARWDSFISFALKKKQGERYFHDAETQALFKILLSTAKERINTISKGQHYWRAQLGCDYEPACDFDGQIIDYNVIPYKTKQMKPLSDKASEGRINPKGIPCLYLASNEKTSISEVRPWVGSYVTVVQFEIIKELQIIDCSCGDINPINITVVDLDKLWKLKQPSEEEAITTIWRWIDKEFSEPIDRNDNTADYIPTQIIAELFKTNGFDGIKYKSLFNNGENLALFDINNAEQVNDGKVFQVTKVIVDYEQKKPFIFEKKGKSCIK
ncbi:MAG: RES family NAD+ phosphorylase [Sedimentisphaerales bacterium]|nr:RES family NAD+ phosphorylase [Sedimentisphaerales bacterium]